MSSTKSYLMNRNVLGFAAVFASAGLFGWFIASGRMAEAFAQDKNADAKAPPTPALVVDGSSLPFPPTPSGSKPGLTIADSVYKKRVEPKRLAAGAPNILVILMDDVGPGTPSTYGGEINTPTLTRVAKAGVSYNRFHSTAMCSPTRASLLTGRNHTRVCNGQITGLANDFDGFSGTIPKSSATVAEVLKNYGYNTGPGASGTTPPRSTLRTRGRLNSGQAVTASSTSMASCPAKLRSTNLSWSATRLR